MRRYRVTSQSKNFSKRGIKSRSFSYRKKIVRHYESSSVALGGMGFYKNQKIKSLHIKTIAFLAIVIFWLVLLAFLPSFRINNITITGNNYIKSDQILDSIDKKISANKFILPSNIYFLVNEKQIANHLKENFPIENLSIKKVFPNNLEVVITEKNSSLILSNKNGYFLLDSEGKAIKKISEPGYITTIMPDSEASKSTTTTTSTTITHTTIARPTGTEFNKEYTNIPIYFDEYGDTNSDNLNIKTISSIIDFDNALKRGSDIKIVYYKPDTLKGDVQAVTNSGWLIKFTSERSIEDQINNLNNVVKSINPIEYIDLRLEDRLFWK